ncbi:MAG TPA: recombinase family protein [Pseudonocardiaceae bacterium]|nr:recombinase family protein [Pseudonocardiaceae bacterium]
MPTGREYLRVSQDRSGRLRSTTEQHDDDELAATERAVHLGVPYRDDSVSASRYGSKARDDFARLLGDLATGRFGADELWLWEPSRGSRKVSEWVTLIETCERAKVSIYVTTHRKLYDPTNARDRRSLLEDAVDAEYESAKTSDRVQRAARSRAAAGRPHGKLLYGYRREYDPKHGGYVRTVIDPVTGPVMVEVYRRYADGEGLGVIAGSLTRRGVPTPQSARVWRWSTLRNLLANPGHLGHRVSAAGHATVEDAWPPLIDEATWYRARARLADPSRSSARGRPEVAHELSGIAECGVCTGRLVYNGGRSRKTTRAYPTYICNDRRCVSRSARGLEANVRGTVFGMWDDEERVGRAAGGDPELPGLEAEHAALVARLGMWRDSAGDEGVSPAAVAAAERKLGPQIDQAQRRLDVARARRALPAVDGPLRDAWTTLPLTTRRTIIAASVTIKVLPAGTGRRYNTDTVQITPLW